MLTPYWRGIRAAAKAGWRCWADERVSVHPTAIAFHLLASSIPFLLVLFGALGYFFSSDDARRAVVDFAQAHLPDRFLGAGPDVWSRGLIGQLLMPAFRHRGAAIWTGGAISLVTGSTLMRAMRLGLNDALELPHTRQSSLWRLYYVALIGLAGAVVFVGAALLWSAANLLPLLLPSLLTRALLFVGLSATNVLLLYCLYRFLPDRAPSPRVALLASGLCMLALEAARRVTGLLVMRSLPRYDLVYGIYAVFVLTAVWMYYSSLIFLISAAAAKAFIESVLGPTAAVGPKTDSPARAA